MSNVFLASWYDRHRVKKKRFYCRATNVERLIRDGPPLVICTPDADAIL